MAKNSASTAKELFAEANDARLAGNLDRAEVLFRQLLGADGANFEARYLLGTVCHQLGKPAEAIAALASAIRLKGDSAKVHNHLGAVLAEQGKFDDAIASFRRASQLDPSADDAARNLDRAMAGKAVAQGIPLAQRGRLDEAAACFKQALALIPDHVDAHNNLGYVQLAQNRPRDALVHFRKAVELHGDYLPAIVNVGSALERSGEAEEAVEWFRRAITLASNEAEPYNNLGVALHSLGKLSEATANFDKALQLSPQHPRARLNRAMGLLLRGEFAEGWREFEWRPARFPQTQTPLPPRWTGQPLDGRTILVRSEEGIGDTLQFVRYAELLARKGAMVALECPGVLSRLIATAPGVDRVISWGQSLPACDFFVPMLSLPCILETTIETIPANIPYLEPDAEAVNHWKTELNAPNTFKIGIVWQGNPNHRADAYRSIPLAQFAPLTEVAGIRLFSLQMGPGCEQLGGWPGAHPITDLSDRLGDFHNTAAAVCNLDLVIACDSAPAHLAGALGVPVWVALAITPDWRWMLSRDDSPWYPTARLFRQHQQGNWQDVFRDIQRALPALIEAKAKGNP
jgi:Flp pilus assembly protein TadD